MASANLHQLIQFLSIASGCLATAAYFCPRLVPARIGMTTLLIVARLVEMLCC